MAKSQSAGKPRGEPIVRERRTARRDNKGNCFAANLTSMGVKVHGIEKGDSLIIEVHEDGFWIEPVDADDLS